MQHDIRGSYKTGTLSSDDSHCVVSQIKKTNISFWRREAVFS